MIHIVVNGEIKTLEGQTSLKELLVTLNLPNERIAIELNKDVIRRKDWTTVKVNDKDRVEVIHFVGGG